MSDEQIKVPVHRLRLQDIAEIADDLDFDVEVQRFVSRHEQLDQSLVPGGDDADTQFPADFFIASAEKK